MTRHPDDRARRHVAIARRVPAKASYVGTGVGLGNQARNGTSTMKKPSAVRIMGGLFATWAVVSGGGILVMPATAWGVPVTFRFSGEAIEVVDSGGSIGGAITVGSPVGGSFVFESAVPDSDPDPGKGRYSNVMSSWEMDMGEAHFSLANFSSIDVEDTPAGDRYQVNARLVSPFGDLRWNTFWNFNDPNGNLVASTALPLAPPDVLPLQTAMSVQFLDPAAPAVVQVRLDMFALASISQPGDLDLDGDVDFDDIGDFVIGINDPAGYQAAHGVPGWAAGDIDGDGDLDFDDIPGFAELLGNTGTPASQSRLQAVPEPASAVLVMLALAGFCGIGDRSQPSNKNHG